MLYRKGGTSKMNTLFLKTLEASRLAALDELIFVSLT
jgi:hypothetical protein